MISPLLLSLQTAGLATLMVATFGTLTAFVLARSSFRGKRLLEALLLLPLILPPTVIGYYLVLLLGRNGLLGAPVFAWTGWSILFTPQAAVVAAAVVAFPIMVRTAQVAIESVDPEMIDSSTMLGYSRLETAWNIILPLAWRGILAGVVLSFTRALGEFGATLMLAGNIPGRTETMPLAIYTASTTGDWQQAHLLAVTLTLTSMGFLWISSHLSGSARKGR